MDKQRYNLLYKPIIGPERQYRSEAKFIEEPDRVIPIVPGVTPDDPVEGLRELEELVPGLPAGLEFIGEIVTPLRRRAEVIQIETQLRNEAQLEEEPVVGPKPGTITLPGEEIKPWIIGTSEPTETDRIPNPGFGTLTVEPTATTGVETSSVLPGSVTTVSGETAAPTDIPNIFPPVSPLTIAVETPKTLVQIAQEGYAKDQIDLQKYYLQQMRLALQRYFQHQFAFMAELGLAEVDMLTQNYDGNAVKGMSANDQHLHDTIIRSQIQRNQKARYFKKLANIEQTLTHMRNWNAAEKLRERYYSEAYGDSTQFVDSEANAVLRQNRSEYDAGYKASLYNMYKYLNSSVAMTEDILDHVLLESKSKAKLIKAGIDIFAQTQVAKGDSVQETLATDGKSQSQAAPSENAKPTPADIDNALGITDPADESVWGLAPNGGHFSQADIDYLVTLNPEYYGTSGDKAEHVKVELSLNSKYMGNSDSDSDSSGNNNGSGQPTMQGTDNVSPKVSSGNSNTRSKIEEGETAWSNGYRLEVKYQAYPISGSTSRDYDVFITVNVYDPDGGSGQGKRVFVVSSHNGKPRSSLANMLGVYTDPVEQAVIKDAYNYLTVDRWNTK